MDVNEADAAEFARQEQIWTGMYGPAQAKQMLEAAAQRRAAHPDEPVRAAFAAVEPNDDDDPDEAGLARPGVG